MCKVMPQQPYCILGSILQPSTPKQTVSIKQISLRLHDYTSVNPCVSSLEVLERDKTLGLYTSGDRSGLPMWTAPCSWSSAKTRVLYRNPNHVLIWRHLYRSCKFPQASI